MENKREERKSLIIKNENGKLHSYKCYEQNSFFYDEDIIGLDANVIVDLVESSNFRNEIKTYVTFNILKFYTTNIALGEARHVLMRKRGYTFEKATESIKRIMSEFNIIQINHILECNELAEKWANLVKQKMRIKKFSTFPNDCRILANLVEQAKINLYITEDQDIENAVKILKLPIRIKIIGEASHLNERKIKEFFKQKRKFHHKR